MCETNRGEAVKRGEASDGEVLRTCSVAVQGSAALRVRDLIVSHCRVSTDVLDSDLTPPPQTVTQLRSNTSTLSCC